MNRITLIICLIAISICHGLTAQNTYLKIQVDKDQEINYPENTQFSIIDERGNVLVDQSSLGKVFEVEDPVELRVKTSWNPKVEIYKLRAGASVSIASHDHDASDNYHQRMPITDDAQMELSGGVSIVKKGFYGN